MHEKQDNPVRSSVKQEMPGPAAARRGGSGACSPAAEGQALPGWSAAEVAAPTAPSAPVPAGTKPAAAPVLAPVAQPIEHEATPGGLVETTQRAAVRELFTGIVFEAICTPEANHDN